jgi:ABC-type sugar transport system substrate-binding protein
LVWSAIVVTTIATGSSVAQTIGVSMASYDDQFLTSVRAAMSARARELNVKIQFEDAHGDTSAQLDQMQNFAAQKVRAIIVNLVDAAATSKMTRVAVAAGIPLVYVNREPDSKTLPQGVAYVGSQDAVAGKLEGEAIARLLGDKGNVAIIMGGFSNNATLVRTQGVEQVVAAKPGMKVIEKQTANWQRVEGMNLVSNWLLAGKKIDAIASNNDEMAIGAIMALQQAGMDPKKIIIGGVDATPDGLAEIAKGNLAFSVFQDGKSQGKSAVDTAVALMRGENVPSFTWIPVQLVTKQNYQEFINR